jgi:NitT/TauT family transport system ATP-binding protein
MAMDDALLALSGVGFAYGERVVLSGIDLACRRGQVVALMGPSGVGKTTLLSLVLGGNQPAEGKLACRAERLSVMFQEPRLLPWRNALDNVAFALKAHHVSGRERVARAEAMLDAVGLPRASHRQFPHQLSGGMRQRVSLARALVIEPDLLLLDEPFDGLDLALVRQMQTLLLSRVADRGMGIVIVTHDARHAAAMADRVWVLSEAPARIVACFDGVKDRSGPSCLALADLIEQALLSASRDTL